MPSSNWQEFEGRLRRLESNFSPIGYLDIRDANIEVAQWGEVPLPAVRVRATSTQTLSTAGDTVVSFDTVVFDSHGFWSSGAPTRITVPAGMRGTYIVGGYAAPLVTSTNIRLSLRVTYNGGTTSWVGSVTDCMVNVGTILMSANGPILLEDGDYVELAATQSGGVASEIGFTALRPAFWAIKVR